MQEGGVVGIPFVIESAGPQAGLFGDGIIAAKTIEGHKCSGQWSHAKAGGSAGEAVHGLVCRAGDRQREARSGSAVAQALAATNESGIDARDGDTRCGTHEGGIVLGKTLQLGIAGR